MLIRATVSTKGQVTLPAAMRAKLGIQAGSLVQFELRGQELVIKIGVKLPDAGVPALRCSARTAMLAIGRLCSPPLQAAPVLDLRGTCPESQ